jgi:outer membrane protein OmpA-like peptidoglycan-associated protein
MGRLFFYALIFAGDLNFAIGYLSPAADRLRLPSQCVDFEKSGLRLQEKALIYIDIYGFFASLPRETQVFVALIFVLFVWMNWQFTPKSAAQGPTILTTLGIFATFFGIATGLLHFDAKNIQNSVPALLSDLMTGLMLMFLLIAMVFMVKVEAESNKLKDAKNQAELQAEDFKDAKAQAEKNAEKLRQIGLVYSRIRKLVFEDLEREFKNDLKSWDAALDERDLTIRFEEPTGKFKIGDAALPEKFKLVLDAFVPRYVKVISNPIYRDAIDEVRIEGHTSSIWQGSKTALEAYFQNMKLSQDRTRTTLEYVVTRPGIPMRDHAWLLSKITANGLSSSKRRFAPDGAEDINASQRVEFKLRMDADKLLEKLLSEAIQ